MKKKNAFVGKIGRSVTSQSVQRWQHVSSEMRTPYLSLFQISPPILFFFHIIALFVFKKKKFKFTNT